MLLWGGTQCRIDCALAMPFYDITRLPSSNRQCHDAHPASSCSCEDTSRPRHGCGGAALRKHTCACYAVNIERCRPCPACMQLGEADSSPSHGRLLSAQLLASLAEASVTNAGKIAALDGGPVIAAAAAEALARGRERQLEWELTR